MKNALLLINLGTPDNTSVQAIRRYLREFLADPRVIDLPAPLRFLLLYAVILPFRPKRLTGAYQSIWMDEGSPLLVHSLQLQKKAQAILGADCIVALGMRYGNPTLKEAIQLVSTAENLCILPLYPQYSSAATGSSIEKCMGLLAKQPNFPFIKIIRDFYKHPSFIQAQAALIRQQLTPDVFLLFSYHGIPVRHLKRAGCERLCVGACPSLQDGNNSNETRCYKAQCYATTELLAEKVGLKPHQYTTSFQSRLGKTPWIRPFTDEILVDLAKAGVKRLLVACPAFVADCLETEEEIGIRAQEQWIGLGGESLALVPSLNATDVWVQAVIDICEIKP